MEVLGMLFGVSSMCASRTFNRALIILDIISKDVMKGMTIPGAAMEVDADKIACFAAKFETVRHVIDASELRCQIPSWQIGNRAAFSTYKHYHTAKFLIDLMPDGRVRFVSKAYAGSTSDVSLVEYCGFLDLLKDGDAVMADKGFKIEAMVQERNCTLILPDFLVEKQLAREKCERSRPISQARIQVERIINVFKGFEILDHIPLTFAPLLDMFLQVILLITHFNPPIIQPDVDEQAEEERLWERACASPAPADSD
jgi:hypothetical protein